MKSQRQPGESAQRRLSSSVGISGLARNILPDEMRNGSTRQSRTTRRGSARATLAADHPRFQAARGQALLQAQRFV